MKVLRLCLLALPLFLSTACLEYTEDLHANADGSGQLRMDTGVWSEIIEDEDVAAIREEMSEVVRQLNNLDEVKKASFEDFIEGDLHHFVLDIKVKDYNFFSELLRMSDFAVSFAGSSTSAVRFEELESGNINFIRVLDPSAANKLKARVRQLQLVTEQEIRALEDDNPFENRFITYRFHAPKILNFCDPGLLDGKTVEWKFPLDFEDFSLFTSDTEIPGLLEAEFSMSTSLWIWITLLVALFFTSIIWLRSAWKRGLLRKGLKRVGAF